MTHGAGGFSSGGGGGGFSGGAGGFAGTSVFHSTRSGGSSDDDGECCAFFCVCGINLITFLLCMRKMSRLVRLVLLWVYVLTFVLTLSLLLRFNMLNINKFQSAPTDMAPVKSHLNNAFCQSMTLNSTNQFTAYSFDEMPRVDPQGVEEFNTSYSTTLFSNNYEYWGFYLLEGSNMSVYGLGGSTMYIIKGKDNLQDWLDNKGSCSGCYIAKDITIPSYLYHLTVKERDTYYIVFFSSVFSFSVHADVYLQRTLLDVSSAKAKCDYQKDRGPCSLKVSLNPDQVIVYHNGRSSSVDQNIDMWSTCEPRIWMYFVVFGLLPVIFGVMLSLVFWRFCRHDSDVESSALTELPDVEKF